MGRGTSSSPLGMSGGPAFSGRGGSSGGGCGWLILLAVVGVVVWLVSR